MFLFALLYKHIFSAKMEFAKFFDFLDKRYNNKKTKEYKAYRTSFIKGERIKFESDKIVMTNYGRIYGFENKKIIELNYWITDGSKKYIDKFLDIYDREDYFDNFVAYMQNIKIIQFNEGFITPLRLLSI